ncbi:MAG: heme exporter protein D [Motiliproteus sp.]|jgi:heme exporter protein D
MYFDSFSDFIAMGGHGLYVWLAYSIALVIIVFNVLSPLLGQKKFRAAYKRRLKREQRNPRQESTQ